MRIQPDYRPLGCSECINGAGLDFTFTMAFQPIVSAATREIFAHEALVRGPQDEAAAAVFAHVNDGNRYRFDQSCRVKAIQLAAALGMPSALCINFMPNAVYRPELCIRTAIAAAEAYGLSIDRIILEVTESEKSEDKPHLVEIVQHYKHRGFRTAIDDFGAGYAGLDLLAEFQPDFVKIDMALLRAVNRDRVRQAIVKGIVQICRDLEIEPIAEGIETYEEFSVLQSFGVDLFQGFYFARPAFEALASVSPAAFEGR